MIETLTNPAWLEGSRYVRFLNRSFPGKWDRVSHEWYVRRAFNGRPTDVIVRVEGRKILAGLACCYRQLRDATGAVVEACILSAVATLPEERRRGHLIVLLDAALATCRERGCAALFGFVTRDNISGHGLLRLGAHALSSFYVTSTVLSTERLRCLRRRPRPACATDLAHWRASREAGCGRVRFHYADDRDWQRQFIERPAGVRALRVAHDACALVETVGDTDRLQWLQCPAEKTTSSVAVLAASSAAAGRRFFLYSMDPLVAAAAHRLGLRVREGILVMMPVAPERTPLTALAASSWHVQSGDRV